MKKLRWVTDGDSWDLDVSTATTLDGIAVPLSAAGDTVPLGLSRGARLSRPKQIDFMQRFMSAPFVPCFLGGGGGKGLCVQRVLSLPFGGDWFTTMLGQFNLQKFVTSVQKSDASDWLCSLRQCLADKNLYAAGICSDILLTPSDTLLVSCEAYGDTKTTRKKALFHHQFPNHNLTMGAVWPGIFIDKDGTYWDVPFSMVMDLASITSDSGPSYHFCTQHTSGSPKQVGDGETMQSPVTLLPGFSLKGAFSFKKNVDIWRSKGKKLPMVQPFDIFLSTPHVSASGIIGAVATARVGENSVNSQVEEESLSFRPFNVSARGVKSSFMADTFATLLLTAQHGNFQRLFLDLTRVQARLDYSSGSKFLSAAAHLGQDLYNARKPTLEAVEAFLPQASFSLQQQIAGPFSFRVDSSVKVTPDWSRWQVKLEDPVFAVEYALQVLGSAKAIAWYAPKHQEAMVELRFFET